jgi:hypothetical protein
MNKLYWGTEVAKELETPPPSEKRSFTIAVDADGTLFTDAFPEIGEPNFPLIDWLIAQRKRGAKLILWTCRGQYNGRNVLSEAITWCKEFGLSFDAVNEDTDEVKASEFGRGKSRKIYADIFIDDRSIKPGGLPLA